MKMEKKALAKGSIKKELLLIDVGITIVKTMMNGKFIHHKKRRRNIDKAFVLTHFNEAKTRAIKKLKDEYPGFIVTYPNEVTKAAFSPIFNSPYMMGMGGL
jgi:hypothetical protein